MTPDVLAAINASTARGGEWLAELMDTIDRDGLAYYRQCVTRAYTMVPTANGPQRPDGMPAELARAIRDHALDEALASRLYGSRT